MEKKNELTVSECIGLLIAAPISAIVRGFVLQKLWLWFIVVQFNQPPITIPVALGIATLVGLLTHQDNSKETKQDTVYVVVRNIIIPLLALFFGWIYTLFM